MKKTLKKMERIGDYIILDLIGEGGFARVYRARHIYLNRIDALKIPKIEIIGSDIVDEILGEARRQAELNHSNIVTIYSAGIDKNIPYIAMEYMANGSLRKMVGKIDAEKATQIFIKILDALKYAHKNHVIHGDITPENILFNDKMEPKLSDFGIAIKLGKSEKIRHTLTIRGKPIYMAPETFLSLIHI